MAQLTTVVAAARPTAASPVRWQSLLIVAIALAIALTEWVFAYRSVAWGIALALGLALTIYLLISTLSLAQKIVNCAESLALIPLYVLFTSSLPWFFLNQEYLLPAVYSLILGLVAWHIYQKSLDLKELFGFRKKTLLRYCLLGVALGIPAGTAEYFVLTPAPAFPTLEAKYLLRDLAYMLLFVGLGEELLFRGLIQRDFIGAFGPAWGITSASLIFAAMHLTWRSLPELGFVFVIGMVLGYIYHRSRSLVPVVIIHGVGNTVLVAVMPYILQ